MAAFQASPPERFNFSRPDEWPKWLGRFERFRYASDLNEKDEVKQIHTLIYSMGDEADDILSTFRLSEEDGKKYDTEVEKFQGYFVKRRNTIFERAKFNRRKQEGEPVDDFIVDLYRLAEHCGYGSLHNEMIRDRLVVGLRNPSLSEKLQMDADLTLEKAVSAARQTESIKQQQTVLRSPSQEGKPVRAVDTVEKQRMPYRSQKRKPKETAPTHQKLKCCTRCGRSPTHNREQCPAREATCHKCGKRGHFQTACRSSANVRTVESTNQEAFMGAVQDSEHTNPWMVTLTVNGKPLEFKIDTGADVSAIPYRVQDHARS